MANLGFSSAPERIVVAIYAFALVFPLFVAATALLLRAADSAVLSQFEYYGFLLPLSITYLAPLLFILLSQPSPNPASTVPLPFQFFIFFGGIAILLFYLVVPYFLWYRYRVAWILSFTASVSTVGLEVYAASTEDLMLFVFWAFGIAANILTLYLLWRGKSNFFNRAVDIEAPTMR